MDRLTQAAEIDGTSGYWVEEGAAYEGLKTFFNGYDEGFSAIEKCAKYEDLEEQGLLLRLPEHYLETIKLLTIAAIAYQENQNIITSRMKGNKEIADLFMELTMVQYLHNHMKLLSLVESGIDVNKIVGIQKIIDIFYPEEAEAALAEMEGGHEIN